MIDWPAFARVVHVISIVHWIGGLFFVTFVILPSLREMERDARLVAFDRLERRFAAQARISTLAAGLSGFYLLHAFGHEERLFDPRFWWLGAMILLWTIFAVMLYVAEPLFLHAWFEARAKQEPDLAFGIALRGHRILSALAAATVVGAVGGAHGLF